MAPRCSLKNPTTPRTCCSFGTYTLRYIRSILASSSVTCFPRISATVRGSLIASSLQTVLPHAAVPGNPHRTPPALVGLRQRLVSTICKLYPTMTIRQRFFLPACSNAKPSPKSDTCSISVTSVIRRPLIDAPPCSIKILAADREGTNCATTASRSTMRRPRATASAATLAVGAIIPLSRRHYQIERLTPRIRVLRRLRCHVPR